MFSEYASKYLSKSQRPAPLFNGGGAGDSDVDDYLEAVSGSTEEGSIDTESDSDSMNSESESDDEDPQNNTNSMNPADPPSELLVERPKKPHDSKRKPKQKHGYSLWKQNVDAWTRGSRRQSSTSASVTPQDRYHRTNPQVPSSSNAAASRIPQNRSPNQPTSQGHTRIDPELGGVAYSRSLSKPLDNTVAVIYLVSLALSLTTATLVALASPPNDGGHVYPIFVYSARSLVWYAVLAVIISTVWLFCLRHFTRAVVQTSVFAVPAVLGLTSFLSIVMSVHYSPLGWHGLAHAAIRLSALIPMAIATLWVLYLRRVKDVMGKAADIVVLSAEVYNQCARPMTILTIVSGILSLIITGLWSFFLAKAFLEGRMGVLLVLWFSFMYLWTWGILCSLLRAVLAIVTAVWYSQPPEHQDLVPEEDSPSNPVEGILGNSIYKAVTFHFSSICLSALVALVTRVPLLILPNRLSSILQSSAATILSTSAPRILNPLTLPTSVVERCSLGAAAKLVGSPKFASVDHRAYRLAKLFLVAGRLCCSLLVGFIAWIHADRVKDVSSVHGYLIAIIAWFIGWTVMGASENMLSMICDALLVNYVLNTESPRRFEIQRLFSVDSDGAMPEHGNDEVRDGEYSD